MLKTLIRGEYNRNLEKYFTEFGREKFFILSAHSIFHNASSRYDTLSRLGNFLGIFFIFLFFLFKHLDCKRALCLPQRLQVVRLLRLRLFFKFFFSL